MAAVVNGVHETDEVVWSRAGAWLIDLASTHDSALKAIARLQTEPKWQVRFNVAAMADEMPERLAIEVLSASLRDKSSRVRAKAVDAAFRCDFASATQLLEQALPAESDGKVRQLIAYYLPLMRGESVIEGGYSIIRTPGGGIDYRQPHRS